MKRCVSMRYRHYLVVPKAGELAVEEAVVVLDRHRWLRRFTSQYRDASDLVGRQMNLVFVQQGFHSPQLRGGLMPAVRIGAGRSVPL
jgi:hypothetical protein